MLSDRPAKIPPQWNQRGPSPPEDAIPVHVTGAQLGRSGVPPVRTPHGPPTPNPRSVKFSPFRTAPDTVVRHPADVREVDAALEHQVFDEAAHGVVGQRGDDRRPHPEAAPKAARHVVLAAALPGRNVRVVAIRSSPGSSRSITSPRATRSQRVAAAGRTASGG